MMNFGLMFFAGSEDAITGSRYRVVLESARFADRQGFSSVWVPERHFTKFGSLYPNPAVLHAALAVATERIRLNAGSVVAPLHNPLRIAEEWAMVDNLSGGRVGVSFASGWNPDDFAFFPERYGERHELLVEGVGAVRRLWRGETTKAVGGTGDEINVRVYPSPVQPELPVWLTAAGNPQTYRLAGTLGANLLTHVLDQDEEQLAAKLALYREARAAHGWPPETGVVTVMLHTFVGADAALVREQARAPFCQYIKSNIGLLKGLSQSRGQHIDVSSMPERDLDEFVNFLYERFAAERGLIGTPESCLPLLKRLHAVGVNEVACLLDFGPTPELILENLPHLSRLKDLCRLPPAGEARPARRREAAGSFSPESVQARCTAELSGAEFDERLRSYGVEIDGRFKAVERIWRRDGEALGRVRLPPGATAPDDDFNARPAFLDACSRVLAAAVPEASSGGFYLPSKVRSLRISGTVPAAGWSHAVLSPAHGEAGRRMLEGDVDIYDFEGRPVARIEGLRLERPLPEGRAPEERASQGEGLTYKRGWVVKPPGGTRGLPGGGWLIFADRGGVGVSLSAMLSEAGAACTIVSPEECDATDPEAVSALVAREAPRHVLHLGALDATPSEATTVESLARDQESACARALHLIQAIAGGTAQGSARLCFVTRGAMAVRDGEPVNVAQSPLWGLARVAAVEHPQAWGGVVDLDRESNAPEAARQLFEWLLAPDGEDMVAFRAGRRHVARLQADAAAQSAAPGVRFEASATYLVTGGLGGLGLEVVRWMTSLGARHLALVARSAPSAAAASAVRGLEQDGVRVRLFRADVSEADELSRVLSEIESSLPPLRGVLHLAGVLDDGVLAGQTWPRFSAAGLAKVEGAWNLHRLTRGAALDFFVLFSSIASLVSVPGQGSYAAANAFLDALAHHRRALGLPALCVNWGPWGEVGHAATAYGRGAHARLAEMGIGAVAPPTGLRLLGTLLGRGETQVGVARVDWGRLFQADPAAALSPLLSEQARAVVPADARAEEPELSRRLRALPEAERREELTTLLSSLLGEALKLKSTGLLTPRQGLFELGLDSILALRLKAELEQALGRPFPATLFFTHPTIESLAEYLSGELRPAAAEASSSSDASAGAETSAAATCEAPSTDLLTEEELARLIEQEIGHGRPDPRT